MKSLRNAPIGIFDSGVGGLTVSCGVRKILPKEDVIYFGDTARVPYGNKSKATITRFAREITAFLMDKGVKIVIVACNTASSLSLQSLRKSCKIPVIGVIQPGVLEAVKITKNRKIGVIGTRSTIASGAYQKYFMKIGKSGKMFSRSCPLFVPLVENRMIQDDITYSIAEKYLVDLKKKGVDTLILGCTHYPILKSVLSKVMDKTVLVDSSIAVSMQVKEILAEKGLNTSRKRHGTMRCYVSDDVEGFRETSRIFLREKVKVKKAVLG